MSSVSRLPRRSRPSFGARLRTYWLVVVCAAAGSAYGVWALANAPAFRLQSLEVSGLSRVARADVVAHAGIDPSANVWLLNKTAIERRIERLPYVDRAHVHRAFPARVQIVVSERVPDGCLVIAPDAYTIDSQDRVLSYGCLDPSLLAFRRDDVPLPSPGTFVRDPLLARLREDARTLGDSEAYRSFGFDRFGGLEAALDDGITVRFGDDADLADKAALVGPILAQLQPRLGQVASIDVRAPSAPVVSYQ